MENLPSANAGHDARITTITLIALIRALHIAGVLPAQAAADQLDARALLPAQPGRPPGSDAAAAAAARTVQALADKLHLGYPLPPR